MIENRRRPAFRVVAVFTLRFAVFLELSAVHVSVTILALCRGVFEERQGGADGDDMARFARDCSMSPD